jgi:glucosamine--fructose-6-phosphate aminotransferase (isomerizing)
MCGIIGGIATQHNITAVLIEGLKKLEYRGYDSSGIVIGHEKELKLIKKIGAPSILALDKELENLYGHYGLGHNRWATHGPVTELNAHPHIMGKIGLVHNGVVENTCFLESRLQPAIKKLLRSTTDSELILANLYQFCESGVPFIEAFEQTIQLIEGTFALLVLHIEEEIIVAHRHELPLYYSYSVENQRALLSSDVAAMPLDHKSYHMIFEKNTLVLSQKNNPYYLKSSVLTEQPRIFDDQESLCDEESFMEKEIFEQVDILTKHFNAQDDIFLFFAENQFDEIHMVGCGSSYHAAATAVFWFEQTAFLPAKAYIASEFRYFPPIIKPNTLLIVLSQSGETADILAAVKEQGVRYAKSVALCNTMGSMLTLLVDKVFPIGAGREVGVASTKAFTAQLMVLLKLSLFMSKFEWDAFKRDPLAYKFSESLRDLMHMHTFDDWAKKLSQYTAMMILGRGPLYSIAMEGALKLKEITYKQVHSLPASELKHGSLALIDENFPVIMLLADDHLLKKNLLTCEEIAARHGKLFIIFEESIDLNLMQKSALKLAIPTSHPLLKPIMFAIPFQILAMKIARILSYDIDKPRNLAKSVTVE